MKELNIGTVLGERRREKGVTQEEVAAFCRGFQSICFQMGKRTELSGYYGTSCSGLFFSYYHR